MLALAIALLGAGLAVDGSLRAEGRAGSVVEGQNPNSIALSGDVLAQVPGPDGALRLGLQPSAVVSQQTELMLRGFAEGGLRLDRGWLRVRQRLGYGKVDLSPLASATPLAPGEALRPVQPPPTSRFVSVQESNTALELELAASSRLRFTSQAAWAVTGGTDAVARETLPLARGPQARAQLEWRASRLDTLRAELTGSDTRYSNGRRASVAGLTTGWRTVLTREAELSLAAGPGVGRAEIDGQDVRVLPYVLASADCRVTVRSSVVSLGSSVEPMGDPLSGDVIERGSLRASVGWNPPHAIGWNARVVGSLALTSGSGSATSARSGDQYLQGELGATYPLGPSSSLSAGARAAFASRPLPGQPGRQWGAFLGYSVQFPLVR
ncbi:MAG TPA: hypothetical protein VFP52_17920 [Myxococcales bacterium]|nr:hypothetical protein [Myxococcales bacterium]